jgi:hypothetical protein
MSCFVITPHSVGASGDFAKSMLSMNQNLDSLASILVFDIDYRLVLYSVPFVITLGSAPQFGVGIRICLSPFPAGQYMRT